MKTVRIDKAQCNYRLGVYGGREIIPAVEKKAGATRNSYLKRSMKLDDKFALGEASKLFSNAIQQTFATGNVLPLASGAFAEVNAEAKRLVEKCATRHAAALERIRTSRLKRLVLRKEVHIICFYHNSAEQLDILNEGSSRRETSTNHANWFQ